MKYVERIFAQYIWGQEYMDRKKLIQLSGLNLGIAGALYNQKIVLMKIQMLNETTNNRDHE